jgi:hypothetical protein
MAKPRFNHPIEPMDLANMRQNGVRSPCSVLSAGAKYGRAPTPVEKNLPV